MKPIWHATTVQATILAMWMMASPVVAASPRLESTFVQLSRPHTAWTAEQWRDLFSDFRRLSLTELIVQWSSYDDVSFYVPSQRNEASPIQTILKLADEAGIKVWVGLAADSTYWQHIQRDPALVDVYLRRLRGKSLSVARALASEVRRHPSFAGWYLSEEIDDVNWVDRARRAVLLTHLRAQALELESIAPGVPLTLSGFSNGNMDPLALAGFWRQLEEAANLRRLLFQDAIGAGKLDIDDLPPYFQALHDAFSRGHARVGIVVELFRQTSTSPAFAAVPAPIARIRKQLELASRYSSAPIVGFAVPEYMSRTGGRDAERLMNDYLTAAP